MSREPFFNNPAIYLEYAHTRRAIEFYAYVYSSRECMAALSLPHTLNDNQLQLAYSDFCFDICESGYQIINAPDRWTTCILTPDDDYYGEYSV